MARSGRAFPIKPHLASPLIIQAASGGLTFVLGTTTMAATAPPIVNASGAFVLGTTIMAAAASVTPAATGAMTVGAPVMSAVAVQFAGSASFTLGTIIMQSVMTQTGVVTPPPTVVVTDAAFATVAMADV